MKDQVTALMEALRLVGAEVERFKRKRQSREETLNAIEAVLDNPIVARAVRTLEPLVEAPGLVPDSIDAPAHANG
jgi:hypothetical protein